MFLESFDVDFHHVNTRIADNRVTPSNLNIFGIMAFSDRCMLRNKTTGTVRWSEGQSQTFIGRAKAEVFN